MSSRALFVFVTVFVSGILFGAPKASADPDRLSVEDASGNTEVWMARTGEYRIHSKISDWNFEGRLSEGKTLTEDDGQDAIGAFRELRLGVPDDSTFAIRLYAHDSIVLFSETTANPTPANRFRFPAFRTFPTGLHMLTYRRKEFAPTQFDLPGDAPWAFFDARGRAFVLSPANHFMISNCFKAADGTVSVGIEDAVQEKPSAPFTFRAILALGDGIHEAYARWGNALTALHGKTLPANDADPVLSTVGYWTDNRSSYWYNFSRALGYEGTLKAIVAEFRAAGIPLGHLQLDSWWYVKGGDPKATPPLEASWQRTNYKHGIYLYEGAAELFPKGVKAFQNAIGLPLVTHSRWVDPTSPYVTQYRLSNYAPTDPKYWDRIMSYLADNGVTTYEQDWLNDKTLPRLDRIADGDEFLGEMSRAAAKYGISIQYCMPLARHFLAGSQYSNLHSIRTSGDGLERRKWNQFLFGSQLASALGEWPWTDVFFSRDRENVLIADLSAGIVGVGDRLRTTTATAAETDFNPKWCEKDVHCGELNTANLHRAMRGDGVVVKPDTSLVPTDESYLNQVDAGVKNKVVVATATTRSAHGLGALYVFAYADEASASFAFNPRKYGFAGPVYVYDYFAGKGVRLDADAERSFEAATGGSYYVVVPVSHSGIALLGDPALFVTLGKKRLRADYQPDGSVTVDLDFAAQESELELQGDAPAKPRIKAEGGQVVSQRYDRATGTFRLRLRKPGNLTGREDHAKLQIAM